METSLRSEWATLPYFTLLKNSVQRNMNKSGEKRVGAGREKSPFLPK